MRDEYKIDPKHSGTRTFLRVVGPICLVCGVILSAMPLVKLFGNQDEPPQEKHNDAHLLLSKDPQDISKDEIRQLIIDNHQDSLRSDFRQMQKDMMSKGDHVERKAKSVFSVLWMPFVGVPLIVLGLWMTIGGYMGAVARYTAAEMAPVAKDTFNYAARGTSGGVRTIASAIGAGISEGLSGKAENDRFESVCCPACGEENDPNANFCSSCGATLPKSTPCPRCKEINRSDAKFCDNCGTRLR